MLIIGEFRGFMIHKMRVDEMMRFEEDLMSRNVDNNERNVELRWFSRRFDVFGIMPK